MSEYVALTDLNEQERRVSLTPVNPDTAQISIQEIDDDGVAYDWTDAYLSVYDAMRLREGLDAFISQAVGADV